MEACYEEASPPTHDLPPKSNHWCLLGFSCDLPHQCSTSSVESRPHLHEANYISAIKVSQITFDSGKSTAFS